MLPLETGSASPLHKLAAKILWLGLLTGVLVINTLVTPFWWAAVFFALCTLVSACCLCDSVMMFKFVYENTSRLRYEDTRECNESSKPKT